MSEWKQNYIALNVSRDMAIIHGMATPTAEEVDQYDRDYRESWERDVAAWAKADAFRAAIAEVDDTVARVVLDLHRPIDDDTAECYGCPSFDGDRESWPCVTVAAVARAVGVEPPDDYLVHRPGPEPLTMPPEGFKPYTFSSSAFVDAMARKLDASIFSAEE